MTLIQKVRFLDPFWRENGRGRHTGALGSEASKLAQKVRPRWGPFGPPVISKSCSKSFLPWTPPLRVELIKSVSD